MKQYILEMLKTYKWTDRISTCRLDPSGRNGRMKNWGELLKVKENSMEVTNDLIER